MPWIRFNDAWKSRSFIEIPLIGKVQRKWKYLVWTCALNSAFNLSSSSVEYAESGSQCFIHEAILATSHEIPRQKLLSCWLNNHCEIFSLLTLQDDHQDGRPYSPAALRVVQSSVFFWLVIWLKPQ